MKETALLLFLECFDLFLMVLECVHKFHSVNLNFNPLNVGKPQCYSLSPLIMFLHHKYTQMHFKNPNNLRHIMIFKRVFEWTTNMINQTFYPYISLEFKKKLSHWLGTWVWVNLTKSPFVFYFDLIPVC